MPERRPVSPKDGELVVPVRGLAAQGRDIHPRRVRPRVGIDVGARLGVRERVARRLAVPQAAALDADRVVVGSRFLGGSKTRRQRIRGLVGRAHRLFVRALLPALGVCDPDAGFKGFDLAWLKRAPAVCREDRWSWDMEILAVARRLSDAGEMALGGAGGEAYV